MESGSLLQWHSAWTGAAKKSSLPKNRYCFLPARASVTAKSGEGASAIGDCGSAAEGPMLCPPFSGHLNQFHQFPRPVLSHSREPHPSTSHSAWKKDDTGNRNSSTMNALARLYHEHPKSILFTSAAALRLLLAVAFPALPDLLTLRAEISTPANSYKRCMSGVHWE